VGGAARVASVPRADARAEAASASVITVCALARPRQRGDRPAPAGRGRQADAHTSQAQALDTPRTATPLLYRRAAAGCRPFPPPTPHRSRGAAAKSGGRGAAPSCGPAQRGVAMAPARCPPTRRRASRGPRSTPPRVAVESGGRWHARGGVRPPVGDREAWRADDRGNGPVQPRRGWSGACGPWPAARRDAGLRGAASGTQAGMWSCAANGGALRPPAERGAAPRRLPPAPSPPGGPSRDVAVDRATRRRDPPKGYLHRAGRSRDVHGASVRASGRVHPRRSCPASGAAVGPGGVSPNGLCRQGARGGAVASTPRGGTMDGPRGGPADPGTRPPRRRSPRAAPQHAADPAPDGRVGRR
jgi:hypothetical protein